MTAARFCLLIFAPLLLAAGRSGAQAAAPAQTAYAQAAPLALRSVTLSRASVPRYGRLELRLDLSATYGNPFDPAQIDVHADFRAPDGHTVRVNGFLNQDFTRHLSSSRYESVSADGSPFWDIRFAPDEVGVWHARVTAQDKSGTVARAATFRVAPSPSPGFLRVSSRNPAVFAYDDGQPFFAIGENMGWGNGPGTFSFDDWLPALHGAGGNWIRVWMATWGLLEWPPDKSVTGDSVPQAGLGVYNLGNAWRVDHVLDTAAQNNIAVMLCLDTYGEFTTGGYFNEGMWKNNPYNAANGGPCAAPADFWTNPTARAYYKLRLRYLAARYGWYANLHAWEFWNEASGVPASWVAEMAQALKGAKAGQGLDPYRHLTTITYGSDAIWRLPEVDFTMTHSYGTGDIADHAPVAVSDARQNAVYGKPHLLAEFGIDWRKSDSAYDPRGLAVNWHNGLWAAALSGDAGGGMLWWWDNYVAPENLYGQLTGLSRFARAVPWNAAPWTLIIFDPAQVQKGPETFSDDVLPATAPWGKAAASDFVISPASVAAALNLTGYLYSPGKPDMRTTPTFHVRYAQPGRFSVHVDTVSNLGELHILLDGRLVQTDILSAAPPADPTAKPPYVSTTLHPEYGGIYQAEWDHDYTIDVPAGSHAITLDLAHGDWIHADHYTLTGYHSSRYPDVLLTGLRSGRNAIFWAQNARHNWKNVAASVSIPPIIGAATALRGLPDGRYQVAWWDTTRGIVTRRETATSRHGLLSLRLPPLANDVAAQVKPL